MRSEENHLGRFAGGLQETCWLAAASVVPLIYNPRGADLAYQPFKFGILILLMLAGMAAWLVRRVSSGPVALAPERPFTRDVLFAVLALLGTGGVASTIFSLDRTSSLWGAPETFQGLPALLALLCLAALVACNLRSGDQLRRLISMMIMAGFAAGLLAILQRAGFDPHHPELLGERSHSTAGHPIYLGGYLVMTIPLTISRLLDGGGHAGAARWMKRILELAVLAVQVAGFVCAESRGPTLALGAMLLAYGIFLGVRSRRRRWVAGVCALGLTGAVALAVVWTVALPHEPGSQLPILKRFYETRATDGGVEVYRVETWKHMPGLMNGRRILLGYGPETLQDVLPQHRAWRGTSRIENRFHNLVWDQLFPMGMVGLAGLAGVWLVTFRSGFQLLGWIRQRRDMVWFAATCGSLSVVGGAAAGLAMRNPGLIGLGAMAGLVTGIVVFAVVRAIRLPDATEPNPAGKVFSGIVIAILAGLVGHLTDMAFVFPTAPTAVTFWLFVGMIHAIRRMSAMCEDPAMSAEKKQIPLVGEGDPGRAFQWGIADAAMLAISVITVLFAFIHQYSYQPMTMGGVLEWSLSLSKPVDGRSSLLWILPVSMSLLCGTYFAVLNLGKDPKGWGRRLVLIVVTPILAGSAYACFEASRVVAIGGVPPKSTAVGDVLKMGDAYERLFSSYLIVAGLLLVVVAWNLPARQSPGLRVPLKGWAVAVFAGAVAIWTGWQFALRPLQANLASQWGAALESLGRPDFATEMYRRAIRIDPRPFVYRGLLATSLLERVERTADAGTARVLLAEAEKVLLEGREVSEFNRSHFLLGQLYLRQALREQAPARDATAQKSARAFDRAIAFEPYQEQVWTQASLTDRLLLGNAASADEKLNRAVELAATDTMAAAASYGKLGMTTPDPRLRSEFARVAALHYDRLIGRSDSSGAAKARFEKAKLLLANRGSPQAVEALLLAAAPDASGEVAWQVHGALAEILIARRDLPGAREHLEAALLTAPAEMREPITRMLRQLPPKP